MKLVIDSRIFSIAKENDYYTNDEIVRFEADQLEDGDLQVFVPLAGCTVKDNDELILTIPDRIAFIAQLLKDEKPEDKIRALVLSEAK